MTRNDPTEKIRVGMVLDQPFPPDARVEREAVALVSAGYEVHLLCAVKETAEGEESPEPREEFYRGIYIHRVDPRDVQDPLPGLPFTTRLRYRGWIRNLYRHLWNVDTQWQTLTERFIRGFGIQVLHIHDLRLVSSGLSAAKKWNIPLVADLHENYPALMEMLKGKADPVYGIQQRKKWEAIENRCVQQADRVLTVVEEAKERLVNKGVPAEKITVIPNTVDMEKFEAVEPNPELLRRYKPQFLLTYVGHINSNHRGIHTLLEAIALLKDEIPELYFVGAGAFRESYMNQLQAIIQRHQLEDRVEFTGWLDETEFVPYIAASDICICPHMKTDHTDTTFPNKLFLYHLYRKPVIVSSCKPLKRYIEETEGGVWFESGDAYELANQIRSLYQDAQTRKTMGEKGQQVVRSMYNWQAQSRHLIAMYNQLTGRASQQPEPLIPAIR